jgi:hypothetical protein
MIHGLQFFLQKVSIACYFITERTGIISQKAAVWNFRGVRRGFERGRYLLCLREENSNLFIYLFIQTSFHTSHSGTYHGNGKWHIRYTFSGIYNLIQLTAGWKEYIKTTVTACII